MNEEWPADGSAFDNPFRAPAELLPAGQNGGQAVFLAGGGYVRQVSVVAVLLIVHGVLMWLVALLFLGMAVQVGQAPPPGQQIPPDTWHLFRRVAGGLAAYQFAAGGLQLWAGVRNLGLRGRWLGIAALAMGMAATMTCYCGPTAVALAIYGFIVYAHPAVAQAFRLRQAGLPRDEVLARFY